MGLTILIRRVYFFWINISFLATYFLCRFLHCVVNSFCWFIKQNDYYTHFRSLVWKRFHCCLQTAAKVVQNTDSINYCRLNYCSALYYESSGLSAETSKVKTIGGHSHISSSRLYYQRTVFTLYISTVENSSDKRFSRTSLIKCTSNRRYF